LIIFLNTFRFGNEKKLNPLATSSRINPGVGNYNISDDIGKHASKFSFGKENRSQSARVKTPGPGTYQTKNFIGNEGPKITISGVRPQSSIITGNLNPGPGAYNSNLNDKTNNPSYGFGKSKRKTNNKEAELVPGAGTYSPQNNSGYPSWSMGKSKRGDKNYTEYVPGPGNYEYTNTLGKGPKVNIFLNYKSLQ
jgi:hypothetical protein